MSRLNLILMKVAETMEAIPVVSLEAMIPEVKLEEIQLESPEEKIPGENPEVKEAVKKLAETQRKEAVSHDDISEC